jgi:hypothetical protein
MRSIKKHKQFVNSTNDSHNINKTKSLHFQYNNVQFETHSLEVHNMYILLHCITNGKEQPRRYTKSIVIH